MQTSSYVYIYIYIYIYIYTIIPTIRRNKRQKLKSRYISTANYSPLQPTENRVQERAIYTKESGHMTRGQMSS